MYSLKWGSHVILAGEVHTGLLQHSHALSADRVAELLSPAPGERVRQATRPIPYSVSPEFLSGVDCLLPGTGREIRVIGTATGRAVVTAGHVLQASSFVSVDTRPTRGRMPWSHYLAVPGHVIPLSPITSLDLADRFLTGPVTATTPQLNLGAISSHTMDLVHRSTLLDRRPPFRSTRTRLRWSADDSPTADGPLRLTIGDSPLRTLRLSRESHSIRTIAQLCEDIAYHDWLLTTLLAIVERSGIGARQRHEAVERLGPAVDHLLHLWMPGAHVDPAVARPLWRMLEDRPGFTRQWTSLVDRVRDQVALATVPTMEPSQSMH